jgi:hypothetical protein
MALFPCACFHRGVGSPLSISFVPPELRCHRSSRSRSDLAARTDRSDAAHPPSRNAAQTDLGPARASRPDRAGERGARVSATSALVDAAAIAAYLGVDRGWVYEHADDLGARRLGSGPRPRLRFDLAEVDSRLTSCSRSRRSEEPSKPLAKPIQRRRRSSILGTSVALLPIKARGEIARTLPRALTATFWSGISVPL